MKKELNKKKLLIVSIIILLIIIIIISLLIKKINKTETEVNNVIDTKTEEQKEDEKIKKLKQSSESDRIKTYVGTYFKYIEQGNLEKVVKCLKKIRGHFTKCEICKSECDYKEVIQRYLGEYSK